jgi:hypothetical protein
MNLLLAEPTDQQARLLDVVYEEIDAPHESGLTRSLSPPRAQRSGWTNWSCRGTPTTQVPAPALHARVGTGVRRPPVPRRMTAVQCRRRTPRPRSER